MRIIGSFEQQKLNSDIFYSLVIHSSNNKGRAAVILFRFLNKGNILVTEHS
jgi:hypothetical protein